MDSRSIASHVVSSNRAAVVIVAISWYQKHDQVYSEKQFNENIDVVSVNFSHVLS